MSLKTIEISEEINHKLKQVSDNNPEQFILEAIKEKLKRKKYSEDELKKAYQKTYEEDLMLTKEFESADFENWK